MNMVQAMKAWTWFTTVLMLVFPAPTVSRHVLLDRVFSDNPPPGQSDASCAHLVRAGLDEGVDERGRPIVEPEVKHLIGAMRTMWWECASDIANALAKYGAEVENAFQMEQRRITMSLNQVKSALERGKPMQSIVPAFEWAQSMDWVYINVKMSHKLDAPATLNVISEGVAMGERSLKFSAVKDRKRFALDLAFHADIDPEQSSTSFGSVGRVNFTLKKVKGGVKWPTLLEEGRKKPVNMHVWWAKQEEYSDELEELEELEEAAAAEAKKASKKRENEAEGAPAQGQGAAGETSDDGADKEKSEEKPLTNAQRLEKAQRQAVAALEKQKRARLEELEKGRAAEEESINLEASTKIKESREALKVTKALVEDEYHELVSKKRSEIEASFESTMSEL